MCLIVRVGSHGPTFDCFAARVATELKRMVIRVKFHPRDMLRLGISVFPLFVRGRLENLKKRFTHVLWRVPDHFRFLKRPASSRDLEKIHFLAATFCHPEPSECPTLIFTCTDSAVVSVGDGYFGWRDLLAGHCEAHEVPANHRGIFSHSNATVLADRLRDWLQKSTRESTTTGRNLLARVLQFS